MANNSNPKDMGGENSVSKETRGRGEEVLVYLSTPLQLEW
jgi:hypothetical protein